MINVTNFMMRLFREADVVVFQLLRIVKIKLILTNLEFS